MAGRPIEALALIALGFRSLSMAPASIGPVKTMILSLDAGRAATLLDDMLKKGTRNIREHLDAFAKSEGIEA
jgi:phosphotransferase system enzyme I (PtsP)